MKTIIRSLHGIPDDTLLSEVKRLAADEREATARLIVSLAEVDTRRLYLGQGCSSLFTFCTEVLRLSEHAAYGRIEAARVCRRFPAVLELLTEGAITLTTVTLLGPHLTDANHRELLAAARHRKRREVEHLVARLRPQPDVRASTRKLPVPKPHAPVLHLESDGTTSCDATHSQAAGALQAAVVPPVRPPVVAPIAPARFKVQMTIGEETHQKLRRAQDLLRHVVPSGDLAAVFDRALTVLVADLEKRKLAKRQPRTAAPTRPRGRHVPAAVRRAVWARDGGRCTFVGPAGRCSETGFLELHHVVPYARGGKATVDNLRLRCRSHNQYEGELAFGPRCGPMGVRERRPFYELGSNRVHRGLCEGSARNDCGELPQAGCGGVRPAVLAAVERAGVAGLQP